MNTDITNAFLSDGEHWAMQNYKWSVPKNKTTVEASDKKNDNDKIVIFLVDDDPIFTKALSHAISDSKGHQQTEIKIFSTGEECISSLGFNPSIVILDYYLDSKYYDAMNGIKVLKKIKQSHPEAKVIILSGQTNVDVALDTIKYKAYDYVSKNENAFMRIGNIVGHIVGDIRTNKTIKNENKMYMVINIVVITLLILFFILSLIINRYL